MKQLQKSRIWFLSAIISSLFTPLSSQQVNPEQQIKASIQNIAKQQIPDALNATTRDIDTYYNDAVHTIQNEFSASAEKTRNFYELATNFETFADNAIDHFNQLSRQRVFQSIATIHQLFNQLKAPKATASIESVLTIQIKNTMNSYIIKLSNELVNLKNAIFKQSGLRQKAIDELAGRLGPIQIEKERKDGWKTFISNMKIIGTEFNNTVIKKLVEQATQTTIKALNQALDDAKEKISESAQQIVKEYIDYTIEGKSSQAGEVNEYQFEFLNKNETKPVLIYYVGTADENILQPSPDEPAIPLSIAPNRFVTYELPRYQTKSTIVIIKVNNDLYKPIVAFPNKMVYVQISGDTIAPQSSLLGKSASGLSLKDNVSKTQLTISQEAYPSVQEALEAAKLIIQGKKPPAQLKYNFQLKNNNSQKPIEMWHVGTQDENLIGSQKLPVKRLPGGTFSFEVPNASQKETVLIVSWGDGSYRLVHVMPGKMMYLSMQDESMKLVPQTNPKGEAKNSKELVPVMNNVTSNDIRVSRKYNSIDDIYHDLLVE